MGFLPISLLDFGEQRAQAGAPAQLALITAAASACRGGRGASSPAGRTSAGRTSACSLPLPHLRGAIASPSIAAGRHKRHGLVGGHCPWPIRRCCGGRAPLPAACRARWRAVMHDRPAYSSFLFSDGDLGERSSGRWPGRVGRWRPAYRRAGELRMKR